MKPTKEHLDKINSRLAGHKMTADSVEVLPFLVFNTAITDRHTIMSREMLAKMAQDLNDGKAAFNKLHSSRETLPVGSSISGRLIETADGVDLQAMMYAVVKRPDGAIFEEGKDLADRYATGAVRACSAGVRVGFYKCNVCGNDIRDWNKCDHIPGSTYTKDEQSLTCIAFMTGHKIVDGIAQDCGIYEVSAVTAGGVAAAGSLTEAFGAYEQGADVKEFKKSVTGAKQPSLRVEFTTAPTEDDTLFSQEEETMELNKTDVEKMLKEHYDPLTQEISSLKEVAQVKADEYTALQGELATKGEEFDAKVTELEVVNTEFAALKESVEALTEASKSLETFKDAYVAMVKEQATKAGEEVSDETFAGKTVEEFSALLADYAIKIAKLPSGQQLEGGEAAETAPAINASFFKI